MPVNQELLGTRYPATEVYNVGREKIREFATAVKATHPAHYDLAAAQALGYSDLVAPPTFAIIIAQQADALFVNDPEAGVDFSRVVHAEQSFQHHRPIIAGDSVQAELEVVAFRTVGAGAMITTQADIRTTEGELVATTTSAIVVRVEEEV